MTATRQVEMQSTNATTFMQSPTAFKTSNTFGSAAKNVQNQQRKAMKHQDSSIFGSSQGMNKSYYSNTMKQPRKQATKTSAYLARFDATRDVNAFWKNIADISLNQNRVENLDSKIRTERNMDNPEPTATIA